MNNSMMRNGLMVEATAANMRAAQPAGYLTYTPAVRYTAMVDDRIMTLEAGQTVHLTSAMAARLTALGATLALVP